MAREVYRFGVTVPHGTTQAAPQVTSLKMPDREVSRVEIKIPPGPHGLVGFQLASGGVQMIPINAGQFINADDETLGWNLEGFITTGAWQMIAYNLGAFDHTLEVRFDCELIPDSRAGSIPAAIDPALLLG